MPAKAGIALHPSCLRWIHRAEQELSSAFGSRVTFLLRGQEKSNPKRRPPRWRALRASGNCSLRCLNSGIHAVACLDDKLVRIRANHPAGFPSPTRRAIGAPVKQRASCAHSSKEPEQEPQQSVALLWLLLSSFITECGPGWPAALPGVPCAAVSRGRQAAQRASPWMDSPFRAGTMPARKARPRLTDLPGRSPASAKRGVVFSWVLLFWTSKREVPRPPKEDESSSPFFKQGSR